MKLKSHKEREVIPFDPAFIPMLERQMNSEFYETERKVAEWKAAEENYYREAGKYMQQRIRGETRLKDLKFRREAEKEKVEENAKELFERLARHAGVLSLKISGDSAQPCIDILTPLLFTDIRLEEGARKTKRACIGQFQIQIDPLRFNLRVYNKAFDCEHWAIRSGVPCQGSYSKDLSHAFTRKDWYSMFDIIFHYLHSTDDGSAYTTSNAWRDRRNLSSLLGRKSKEWAVGDHVIVTAVNADGKALLGYTGKVLYTSQRGLGVEFQKSMGGHKGDAGSGKNEHCWNVPKSSCEKITKEQHEAKEVYSSTGEDLQKNVLEKIDGLPDGSTIEEAKSIARDFYQDRLSIEFGI